ncbi:MAG: hypothetical protein A2049_10935 [Elusimicrobia bacterium GWA2_62_23]|nr:MAG: hypothetical protein A2049_10935 [Elusimicrobia bacterium GWA2_62_23]
MTFRKVFLFIALPLSLSAQSAFALNTGRHGHTTTLLPDGNILVTGGVTGAANVPTNSDEIYFTSAAAFGFGSASGMIISVASHTATLMGNGVVLVAGGFNAGVPVQQASLYNAKTGAWTDLGNAMTTRRGGHTATLISKGANSGKVLICGGQTNVAGIQTITDSCEIYSPNVSNPLAGTFAAVQPMSSERIGHSASAIAGGRVFVSGGRRWDVANTTWTYLSTNEIYDPTNNQWQPVTALNTGRTDHSAVVLNNGSIMISGGYNGVNKIDSPEEYWYRTPEGAAAGHTPGSKGYLESAEIFDSYGGRVPISGTDYLVMPYRNSKHAAALTGDGRMHMYGGYGNIPPTYFSPSLVVQSGQLNLTKTDITTATINSTSMLQFLGELNLSRSVSGRLVDADIFLSRPSIAATPSITASNASAYLGYATVRADGSAVGVTAGLAPGEFRDILTLGTALGGTPPTGRVVFSPQQVTARPTPAGAGSQFCFVPTPLPPQNPAVPLTAGSRLDMTLAFDVPAVYIGGVISGSVTINSGSISDDMGFWVVNLTTGTTQFTSGTVYLDIVTGMGVASGNVSFTNIEGTVLNSTVTALTSCIATTANDSVPSLSLRASYTSSLINIDGLSYNVDRSSFVIREMIFADDLGYSPAGSSWEFGPTLYPIFNNTALVTPGADVLITGGRTCDQEGAPGFDCLRTNKVFTASRGAGAFISQNLSGWPNVGNLLRKRAFHSSTLLPNGRILTCGGADGTETLDSCELFNINTQVWTSAGRMNSPRSRHTATLLPNGRVLAAGGTISSSTHTITTAEIYYPDTDRWIPVNSMTYPRANHSAVLMPDGNVLMAGGDTINGYSATSELFITTSTVWVTVGSMATGRAQHTATLLRDGNVMVTGGINGTGPLKSMEIYDGNLRTWSEPGYDMQVRRYAHTANLLLDGRVMVTGGSNGTGALPQAEIFSGTSWRRTTELGGNDMLVARANHRSTLLPNGKLMLTGGERSGEAHYIAEGYDVDFSTFQFQGTTENRSNHTAVLTSSGMIVVIGGWDGAQYLDSTEMVYFSYNPDSNGFSAAVARNPVLSTATALIDRGTRLTLLSATSNFHSISEASGGGAGSMNSSFHNPRVYLQQVDSPSGFLLDMTTRLYTLYNGPNIDWDKTVSSITVVVPATGPEIPYGWYTARVAANGQFSAGVPVQVASPRPTGAPSSATGSVLGTSSITWTWANGSVVSADGYTLYSSSDGVFISTTSFGATASYTQTGLQPNTQVSVNISAYNMGGGGPMTQSSTYYTLASTPTALRVDDASFTTALLGWEKNNNSPATPFELSMCADGNFNNPVMISTPIPFSLNYTSTYTLLTSLSANKMYYFRVRARNGAGIMTDYANIASTITVAAINNFTGTAVSTQAINWAWSSSTGADYYELFDVSGGTSSVVFVGSTTYTDYTQAGLEANRPYVISARAVKTNPGYGPVNGPPSNPSTVYTLAVTPSAHPSDPFINVTTGSFTINWLANGNSTWTAYGVAISTASDFDELATTTSSVVGETKSFGGLGANTKYYIKLAAINGDGIPSADLSMGTKYTLARPPVNVYPADIQMSGVTLAWDQNANSPETIYEVRGTTSSFTDTYTTYLAFYQLFTGNSHTMSGLLTSTTYYFDVAARNGEGLMSARAQSVPPAFTTAGPNGAPAGSIGGVTSPSAQTTIHGWLPNTREITLTVPAGSFPEATSIAVSSSVTSACGGYTVCGRTMEVAVFSENGAQPQVPVTLELGYECTITDTSKLVMARYNPVSGQCLPLETKIDPGTRKITATLNHFSVFQLMVRNAASSLSDVLIYPNPFRTNRGNGFVTIANMPAAAKVRLYTLSGDKVWEGTADNTGIIIWRGVNKAGEQVASGIYLAVIDSSSGKKVFKLAVER